MWGIISQAGSLKGATVVSHTCMFQQSHTKHAFLTETLSKCNCAATKPPQVTEDQWVLDTDLICRSIWVCLLELSVKRGVVTNPLQPRMTAFLLACNAMIIKNSRWSYFRVFSFINISPLSHWTVFTTAMKGSVPALYVLEYRFLNYKCLFSNLVHIFW